MLTKTTDPNSYNLCVINTGSGLNYHQGIRTYKKDLRLLGCYYKDIPKEKLLHESNTSIFSDLLQLLVKRQLNDFDPKMIYEGILAHLSPYRDDAPLMNSDERSMLFVTPQKGGSCTFRVIKAFIRLHLYLNRKTKEDYKEHIRLIENLTFQKYQENLSGNLQSLELLRSMDCKIAKRMIHRKELGVITDNADCIPIAQRQKEKHLQMIPQTKPAIYEKRVKSCSSYYYPSIQGAAVPKDDCNTPIITHTSLMEILNEIKEYESNVSVCHYKPYILHKIDRFALSLPIKRGGMSSYGCSFVPIFKLLKKYCHYLFPTSWDPTPRYLLAIYTLYFALWDLFPKTFEEIKAGCFCSDIEKVKKLLGRLVPPKDLFQKIDEDPFFIITNPEEQSRFKELREAFSVWNSPENPYDVFAGTSFLTQKILTPESTDPEFRFYREYMECVGISNYDFAHKLGGECGKSLETQAFLATKDKGWDSFTPFTLLRRAHYFLGVFTHKKATYDPRYYHSYKCIRKNTIKIEKRQYLSLSDLEFLFQGAYGIHRHQFPSFINSCFKLSTLREKQQRLESFSTAIQKQADPLEADLNGLKQEDASFLRELASFTSAQPLATHQLLLLYSQHASRLQNAEERILFMTQLFKTSKEGDNFAQLAISPDNLTTAAHHFAKTLKRLACDTGKETDHELFLFSSYVITTIAQYYDKIPEKLVAFRDQQKLWMDQKLAQLQLQKGSETHQRLYHLHLLYHLTRSKTKETLTKERLIEALSHYFAVCTLLPAKNHPYLFLESAAIAQMHMELPSLANLNTEELEELTRRISIASGVDCVAGKDCLTSSSITHNKRLGIISLPEYKVRFHYATGDTFYQGQLIKRSDDFRSCGNKIMYQRLFDEETFPTFSVGKVLYLQHPAGTFRKIDNQITFKRQDQKSWALFIAAECLSNEIPLPFRAGYTHFYCPDKHKCFLLKVVIIIYLRRRILQAFILSTK
ncbi:MAG: hypothetical protein P0S93_03690 [Candidatus Neptunochlamydia sp.]|nr:hypothetical protein [Candidatus Neptunochlamydia sp.]